MANRYDITFTNQINDDVQIIIEPREEEAEQTVYLDAVANSFFLSSSTVDDDKTYCGIVSKELRFGYVYTPQNDVGIETFLMEDFDFWRVTCRINGGIVFQGYLSLGTSQRLMNRKEDIYLSATDGMNFLKSFTAYNEEGKNTVLFNVVQCLGELNMPDIRLRTLFNVTSTLMPGRLSDASFDPLDNIWIEDKLFAGMDCHQALTLICENFKCRIYQEGGFWWLEHIGERLSFQQFCWSEYSITEVEGFPFEYTQEENKIAQDVRCLIGHDKPVKLVNADATKYVQLPKQTVKLTFDYNLPDELFCNQKFDLLEIPITTSPTEETYQISCWTHGGAGSIADPDDPLATAYVHRFLDSVTGEEEDRYAVLPAELSTANSAKLYSPFFEIGSNDTVTVTITRRLKNGYTGSGEEIFAYMRFFADDDTYYWMGHDGPNNETTVWSPTTAAWSTNAKFIGKHFASSGEDRADWATVTATSPHCPKAGRLQLILIEGGGDEFPNESWFQDVAISIRTYITNSNTPLIGDYNLQREVINAPDKIEQTVKISDIPTGKRYILGGLYRGPDVDTDIRELYPKQWDYYGNFVSARRFTQLMAGVLHGHTKRSLIKIETSFKAYSFLYGTTPYQVGFLPRYQFSDYNQLKEFMLTGTYEIDLTTGIGRAVFVETLADYRSSELGDSDYYEFQYIAE